MSNFIWLLVSLPRTRRKQQQHREQLQSACEHIENQNELAHRREKAEVAGRAAQRKTRADVVERGRDRGEAGHEILTVQRYNEQREDEDERIGNDEHIDRAHDLMRDALAVHLVDAHQTRVDEAYDNLPKLYQSYIFFAVGSIVLFALSLWKIKHYQFSFTGTQL